MNRQNEKEAAAQQNVRVRNVSFVLFSVFFLKSTRITLKSHIKYPRKTFLLPRIFKIQIKYANTTTRKKERKNENILKTPTRISGLLKGKKKMKRK